MALEVGYTTETNLITSIVEVADPVVEDAVIATLPTVATVTATPVVVASGTTTTATGVVSTRIEDDIDDSQDSFTFTTVSGTTDDFVSTSGVLQIESEEVYFDTVIQNWGDTPDYTQTDPISTTFSGLIRGYNSTTPVAHSSGTLAVPKEWASYVSQPTWDYTITSGTPEAIASWRDTNYSRVFEDSQRSLSHKVWTSNKTTFSGASQFAEFKNLEIEDITSSFSMTVPSGTISGTSNYFVGVEFPIERTTKWLNMSITPDSGKAMNTTDSGVYVVEIYDIDNVVTDTIVIEDEETYPGFGPYNVSGTNYYTPMYFGYSQDNTNWTYVTLSGYNQNYESVYYVSDNIDDIDAYVIGENYTGEIDVLWDFVDKFRAKYYKSFFTNFDYTTLTGSYVELTQDLGYSEELEFGMRILSSGTLTLISGSGAGEYSVDITNLEILQSESGYDVRTSTLEQNRPTDTASSYWRSTGSSVGWDLSSYSGVPPTVTGTWATLASAGSSVSTDDGSNSTAIITGRFFCSATQWECRIYETVSGTLGTTSGVIDSQVSPIAGWIPITTIKTYADGDYVNLSYQMRVNGSLSGVTRIVDGEGVRFTA